MKFNFSKTIDSIRRSEIRDLMSISSRDEIISFAGGMPNNNMFPIDELDEIYNTLPEKIKKIGFQYCATEGYAPLIETLKLYLKNKGFDVENNKILITTGSLQALNLIGKVFVDANDVIITENPSFIGALSAFKSYSADLKPVDIDDDGIIMSKLEQTYAVNKDKAKLLYVMPFFHNPSGIIYSKQRKQELIEFITRNDIVMIEDDAYGELYFDDKDKEMVTTMKVLSGNSPKICYVSSFSKIFGPGMRLGWMLVSPEIYEKCELAKQSIDACSPTFTQVLANEFLTQNKLQPYLQKIRQLYKIRRDKTLEAIENTMPNYIKWTKPKGGFYIWITMPESFDATEILKKVIDKGVVIVTGKTFDPLGVKNNNIRLAFSNMKIGEIQKGIEIIAHEIKEYAKKMSSM